MAIKNNAVLMLTDSLRAVQQIPDKAQRCDIYERFFAYQLGEECATESNPLIDALITMMVSSYERYKAKRDDEVSQRRDAGRKSAVKRTKTTDSNETQRGATNINETQRTSTERNEMQRDSTNLNESQRSATNLNEMQHNININSNINYNPPIVPPRMGETHTRVREEGCDEELSKVQDVADCATSALQDNATPLQTTPQTTAVPVRVTRKFTPPTVEEVAQYCQEKGYSMSPEAFCDYYESVGWRVGRTGKKMEKWRSAVNNWERRDKEMKPKQTTNYEHIDADTRDARELARLNAAYLAIQNGEL